jgi:hypothetical protein
LRDGIAGEGARATRVWEVVAGIIKAVERNLDGLFLWPGNLSTACLFLLAFIYGNRKTSSAQSN